jgi:hypothetical protein
VPVGRGSPCSGAAGPDLILFVAMATAHNTRRGAPHASRSACVDALLLSRIQFGFVISCHILFPAFTIGLAS